ncbi:uncharacterized protein K460DRAFT_410742 [Cucurbitaria berberidis CBS 394.84]|uniref:Uncharacterized protein n=1 Tax=Cucurbitaria berberidis CBS 394.84 TaxID=1168544 RepID=A0A9P4L3A1_9PLEO|nr:uncharacterized protein K460DRAFT_410742 [Cucurbitaria berberidis CBS 394.84]KAF1840140.1 hypothetical protein K460DRAFT_410742 [Cucurbitaria berberidis CBS 394.84]
MRSSTTSTDSGLNAPHNNVATTQETNTETPTQQLAESHAAQRDLERRIAELHEAHARSVHEINRHMERKTSDLLRELEQHKKREAAIQAMFVQNYEKEQELARKVHELEAQNATLQEKEQPKVDKSIAALEESSKQNDDSCDNYPGLEKGITIFSLADSVKKFGVSADHKRPKWFDGYNVDLLRRHDYYKGWLDCMRAFDDKAAAGRGSLSAEDTDHVFDVESPFQAGCSVGALFSWSALCNAHGVPQRDNRLDDRQWFLEDLVPKTPLDDLRFWEGVQAGKNAVEPIFLETMRNDSWQTCNNYYGELEER